MPDRTRHVVALLPWGDSFEDYLDPLGVSLETFAETGSGGWLFGYARALRLAGVESVIVLMSSRLRAPRRWINQSTGLAVVGLPVPSPVHVLSTGVKHLAGGRLGDRIAGGLRDLTSYASIPAKLLREVLRAEECDAIIVQEYESPRFDVLVALGRWWKLPVFATFQGGISWGWRWTDPIRRRAVRSAAGFFIGPASEVERVRRDWNVPSNKIFRVFNPLDTGLWWPDDKVAARRELGLSLDATVIVWHGRVDVRRKGLDVLIGAWRKLLMIALNAAPKVQPHLLLVGSGQGVTELRDLLADVPRATWTWIDRYEQDRAILRRYLSAADVSVLPSRHEGFPVAPLEALACGLPIVATDAPGVADILADAEASGGVMVPREDAAALAAALWELATAPAQRAELATAARYNMQTRFSLQRVGRQLAAAIYPTLRKGEE